jgi:hypothetical protein
VTKIRDGETMPGVCYQLRGDNRRVTHSREYWREAFASHRRATHGGKDDKNCPACAQLKRRIGGSCLFATPVKRAERNQEQRKTAAS